MQAGGFRDLRHKSNMDVCAQQEVVAMHPPFFFFFAFSRFYLQRSSRHTGFLSWDDFYSSSSQFKAGPPAQGVPHLVRPECG